MLPFKILQVTMLTRLLLNLIIANNIMNLFSIFKRQKKYQINNLILYGYLKCCNMNAYFSFDLFMVYIPECKQQLRTMK